jgi:phasin
VVSPEWENADVTESEAKAELNGADGVGLPLFGFPTVALGALAEQAVARTQEGCEKIKAAAEEIAETLRETYSGNAKGATDYGLKVIEISRANTASAIDFIADLLTSKSASDIFALSTAQARKMFDASSAQNKELWEIASRLASATGEPIKKHAAKAFQKAG